MTKTIHLPDYAAFVTALKARILDARTSAARAVNRDLVLLYWDIGRAIAEKQKLANWGNSVVERLATDLQASFPDMHGFSARNVWDMRRLFDSYSSPEFLRQAVAELDTNPESAPRQRNLSGKSRAKRGQDEFLRQLVAEIPWGHHLLVMNKLDNSAARLYYLRATAHFGWSRNVLLTQIKAGAYERAVQEKKAHNFTLALPENLAEHAGKMDFYLNLLNARERAPDDAPSIGIILCAEKDDVEVEFALKTKGNPIGVAEYRLQARLPAEFKGRLPTANQLADALRAALPSPKSRAQ